MFRLFVGFCICSPFLAAAPLPVDPFPDEGEGVRFWALKGEPGRALAPGAALVTELEIPPLTDKEREAEGKWYGLASVDTFGVVNAPATRLLLEVFDPATGEVIGSTMSAARGPVARSAWTATASSEQFGQGVDNAFDGSEDTMWHSDYDREASPGPHWIGLEFGRPVTLPGIRVTPRMAGGNGVAREYRVEIRRPGAEWEALLEGETPRDRRSEPLELPFERPVELEAFRFVIVSDFGDGFGSASKVELLGLELPPSEPVRATGRVWVHLDPEMMEKLVGSRVGLRLRNSPDATVVIGAPRVSRLNDTPRPQLFGRSNGGLGPDKFGAGLLGFEALSEHAQAELTVMSVPRHSPARSAGLREGDAILAVGGSPLSVNDVAPGWNWVANSHESFIGRKTEEALRAGQRSLPVTVLREGELHQLEIELRRDRAFTTLNPADDPQAAAMLADTIGFLERSQRDNGSWSDCMIRTSFSAMALLATGETKHRARIRRAVDWAKERYPEPERYGNLGFWAGAYAGMLYSEYHLATGDRSVLPHMDALRQWATAGHHISSWGVPALGHGTDGLPYDNKALVAPACHLLVAEALAMRAGQESSLWELLMPYMEMSWSDPAEGGHGSLGYNRSYKDREEFWSRTGLFAMAAHLRGEREDMRDAMIGFMKDHHPWFRNSHAYGEPGGGLGMLALNLIEPDAYLDVIRQYDWSFSLAWEPGYGLRFTQPHMGAPYMGEDDLMNAVYALVLQGPRRSLHLTGKHFSDH